MKKVLTAISIILIIALAILLISPKLTGNLIKNYSYTKAFCNSDNHCKDYYVECSGKKVKSITPTGFSIQKDNSWEDDRENTQLTCD